MNILNEENPQTNSRAVNVASHLWLPFSINKSALLNKVKKRNIQSICGQQLFHSLRAPKYGLDEKKILKDQIP